MTTNQLSDLIASIGLPYAQGHFTKDDAPGGPPFICFLTPRSDNLAADDRVYKRVRELNVELYTDEKDPALEARVEAALDGAEDTRDMKAVKGRASYQTNKGVGHLDPGAVTMSWQIEGLCDLLIEKTGE